MRNVIFTLILVLAVFAGTSHASALSQHDDKAASVSYGEYHHHSGVEDHDQAPANSDDPGAGQLTHSHCAMASLLAISPIKAPDMPAEIAAPSPVVMAMSSLGFPPPLEPPSA